VNRVTIMGNVGADPEHKQIGSGAAAKTCCRFQVATEERWTGADGAKKSKTSWHRITAWGPVADVIVKHVKKGRKLLIEAKLDYGSYVDPKTDVKHYTTDLILQTFEFADRAQTRGDDDDGGGRGDGE